MNHDAEGIELYDDESNVPWFIQYLGLDYFNTSKSKF